MGYGIKAAVLAGSCRTITQSLYYYTVAAPWPAVPLHKHRAVKIFLLYYYTHYQEQKFMTMKKEKGWQITKFEVTVKHRPYESRRYIAQDMAEQIRSYDTVKAVRAKISRNGKEQKAMREAVDQMEYALSYIRDVRKELTLKLTNSRHKINIRMWSIDLIDDLWLVKNRLEDVIKSFGSR